MTRSRVSALTALIAATLAACWRVAWPPGPPVAHTLTAYTSGGRRVAVERVAFTQRPSGRMPAVLVLHSSAGLRGRNGRVARHYAESLARAGYVAFVVHYFDRTGDTGTDDAREDAVFPEWTDALRDAVTFAQHDPQVDPRRVAAFGYSLGAYMALALGAADPRVGAIAVLSGGFFTALAPTVTREPPTLLLHGTDDRVVSLDEGAKVANALERLGVAHEMITYPRAGHGLALERGPELAERVITFFRGHLRGGA